MKKILTTALLTTSSLTYGAMCKVKVNVTEVTLYMDDARIDNESKDIEAEVNQDTYDKIKVGDFLMIENDTVKSKVIEKIGCE